MDRACSPIYTAARRQLHLCRPEYCAAVPVPVAAIVCSRGRDTFPGGDSTRRLADCGRHHGPQRSAQAPALA
jgi:hypothetical protein